jgi:hypothetical protein
MEKEVLKGPAELAGAEEIARELRGTPTSGLQPQDYYAAAGYYKDGIVERINADLAKRFPGAPRVGPATDPKKLLLAYAHLEIGIPFEFHFQDAVRPLQFKDSTGKSTPVRAFGIREEDKEMGGETFRGQVRLLFHEGEEFALDLSRKTKPYQVVLARVKRKATLISMLEHLGERTTNPSNPLAAGAIVLVPNMEWKIDHHFTELQGKELRHPVLPPETTLFCAQQLVHFRLDRRGAMVKSTDILGVDWSAGSEPEHFLFDRPYLIVLRNRDSQQPFFVMWVDNAELLQRQ